jgi:hypothetical protein
MGSTYTGRKAIRRDGRDHIAEITVRPAPGPAPSQVILSAEALEDLRSAFGADFEYHRHNVWAAIAAQIDTANVAGEMPQVGVTSFHAEVVRVRVSGDADGQLSGFLLTVAGMNAIGDWENAPEGRVPVESGPPTEPGRCPPYFILTHRPPAAFGKRSSTVFVAASQSQASRARGLLSSCTSVGAEASAARATASI